MDYILGILLGVIGMFSYGVQDFLMAKASRHIGAFKTSFWFQIITLIFLVIISVFLYKYQSISLLIAILIVFTGIISMIGLVSFNKGLSVGNVSIITTIASVWSVVSILLGYIFLKTPISLMQTVFIAFIIMGTILASLELKHLVKMNIKHVIGLKYAIITVFGWGIYFFLIAYLVNAIGWVAASLFSLLATVIIMFIYAKFASIDIKFNIKGRYILLLIAILNTIGFLSYSIGLTYNYVSVISPIIAAGPVITIMLALFLLKERLELSQKVGIIMVISGIILLAI